jgi:hypothetical protein
VFVCYCGGTCATALDVKAVYGFGTVTTSIRGILDDFAAAMEPMVMALSQAAQTIIDSWGPFVETLHGALLCAPMPRRKYKGPPPVVIRRAPAPSLPRARDRLHAWRACALRLA